MSSWASYTTSQNYSFLNCKNRIFAGALWNWQGMVGKVVDVAHFVCPALLLSSRVSPSAFYGTALPTHFRIHTPSIVTPAYTSCFPIIFLHALVPLWILFSPMDYPSTFLFVGFWPGKFLPILQYIKSHFLSQTFAVIFSHCICSQKVVQIYFIVHNSLYCGFTHTVQFSRSVVSSSLWPHELQHARPSLSLLPRQVWTGWHQMITKNW